VKGGSRAALLLCPKPPPRPRLRLVPRYIGRENLHKRLQPLEGGSGRTIYAGGWTRIEACEEAIAVRPPFGLGHEAEYDRVELKPLFDALDEDHVVGALLVRLGGYAVGVFEGERLAASKVGTRFVKGKHKKGGSSSNRFRRRRDEQARALIGAAAATARKVLGPWEGRIEWVALGGDRRAVDEVIAADPGLGWLRDRALPRFFAVPDPRLRELERLPYDLYAAEFRAGERRVSDLQRQRP
jgi:Actinobacteria/chloroflexi VLRF1 release factor